MKRLKRGLYLLYYLANEDRRQLRKFVRHAANQARTTRIEIIADVILSVLRYNISLKDFFCFGFYRLGSDERSKWAGSGFMYEYQLIMNPKASRDILENKVTFLNHYRQFVKRNYSTLTGLESDMKLAVSLLSNPSGKLVLKGSKGQVGAEVEIISVSDYDPESLIAYMRKSNYDLVEEYVIQHDSIMELSSAGLNTVRVFTQLNNDQVDVLGVRFRITVNSPVDNMAAGNLAAPVDLVTGEVTGPGIYSDITKEDQYTHPLTGRPIKGFILPNLKQVLELAINAAMHDKSNKSVGWDIAITQNGVDLIEGNHNWCRLLWQMPVKRGMKETLVRYL